MLDQPYRRVSDTLRRQIEDLIRNESKPGSFGEPLGAYAGVPSPRSPSHGLQPDPVSTRHVAA